MVKPDTLERAKNLPNRLGENWGKYWGDSSKKFIETLALRKVSTSRKVSSKNLQKNITIDGFMGFLLACKTHDSKRSKFSTHLYNHVNYKMLDGIKSHAKFNCQQLFHHNDLESDYQASDYVRLKSLLYRTVMNLENTYYKNIILDRYYNKLTIVAIGEKHSSSIQKIRYHIRQAIKYLKQYCHVNYDTLDLHDAQTTYWPVRANRDVEFLPETLGNNFFNNIPAKSKVS